MTRFVHGISTDLLRAAFCDYFGVAEEHADILVLLYERPGKPIPPKEMARLLNSHRPPTRGAIHERIRFIREIMEDESIESGLPTDHAWEPASGYFLTTTGMAECAEALRVMAEALMRCGPVAVLNGQVVEDIRRAVTARGEAA
jgi:glycine/D-amino acid oxidase-like deaminating enzyme